MTEEKSMVSIPTPIVKLADIVKGFVPNRTVMRSVSGRKMMYLEVNMGEAMFVAWEGQEVGRGINFFSCPLDQFLEDGEKLQQCKWQGLYNPGTNRFNEYESQMRELIPNP